jgi:signal peptidase I
MTYKPFLPLLGVLIPGAAQCYVGRLQQALLFHVAILATIVLLAWTRLIVSTAGLMLLIAILIGCHTISAISAFSLQRKWKPRDSSFRRLSRVIAYSSLSIVLGSSLFIYKSFLFGIELYQVESQSMHPTLQDGDYILVDTWAYNDTPVKLLDVVVFRTTGNGPALIKRVHPAPTHFATRQSGQVYLLGDNRNRSLDSRVFGLVDKNLVVGKVKFVIWPGAGSRGFEGFIDRVGNPI